MFWNDGWEDGNPEVKAKSSDLADIECEKLSKIDENVDTTYTRYNSFLQKNVIVQEQSYSGRTCSL